MDNSTRLFGRKTKKDWIDIRTAILESPRNLTGWNHAVDLMRKRFETRYFRPITQILDLNITTGEGFAVVSLMCSLIEFFQSCIEGKNYEHNAKETEFVYGISSVKFKLFLTTEYPFREIFNKPVPSPTNRIKTYADDFYINVRCGLLHEASTKNNWVIRTSKKNDKNLRPNVFIDVSNDAEKIIFRDKFFSTLKAFSENYLNEVSSGNDQKLRTNYCRKMDSICEIRPSNKVIWWQNFQ